MRKFPISHFLICANITGHAYWLSQHESGFPNLRKLKARRFPWGNLPEEGYWEDVDVTGFNKPYAHLIDVLTQELQPPHTLLVCDSDLDRETAKDVSGEHGGQIYAQSSDEWLKCKNLVPWQPQVSQPSPTTQPVPRYFEYVNYSEGASKFWEITLRSDGLGYQSRYGHIGTKGQSRLKVFTTPFACRQAYDKIIQQKLRKGYIEV
jgi:predicted DNA-binding WGR domain protein